MNVQSYLQTRTKTAVTLFALGLTVLLGALDYWVKPQFSVSIFYLLPVALAAWFGGTQALVGIAVFWVVAWLVNGSLHSLAPFPLPVPWWDAVVQILFGFVLALLLTRLKALSTTVEQQVADRTASLTAAIAERQRLEAAAKLQFAQLVLDKMWDPAFWVGPAGRFIYVNDAACRQLGYSRTELLARGVSDIDPSLSAEQWAQVWRTMQTEKYRVFEQRQRTKDGRILPVELAVSYLNTLLAGDSHLANQLILDAVRHGFGVKDIYLHVFQPCQQEIGRLWQMNRISVAQEHFCTVVTQTIMSQLYPYIFATEKNGRRLVATSVSGELHEIGMRMVADFLEMEGWTTYYGESPLFSRSSFWIYCKNNHKKETS